VADDPQGKVALELWLKQRDDLLAGRTPRVHPEGLTIKDLANRFLTNRRTKLDSGELAATTFADYHAACARLVRFFGPGRLVADLDATDFERLRASMAKDWSPVTLHNEIGRIRVVLRYTTENLLIPGPIRYGSAFAKPSRKTLQAARAVRGVRMFEAEEIRAMLAAAPATMKAMILLGLNCGFGNLDVAKLPATALDLQSGWVNFPRPKTAIPRRCSLWPETVQAIRAAIAQRPNPKDPESGKLVFLTVRGVTWGKRTVGVPDAPDGKLRKNTADPICQEFRKLLKRLGLYQPSRGFYSLRHTLETIGGEARDQVALDAIMGHVRDDMASVYRERIGGDRLLAVVNRVHEWLWPVAEAKESK
jgi:integrase